MTMQDIDFLMKNKEKEIYNPEIHCCEKWYKTYCGCVNEHKKKLRDTNVNDTLDILKSNNIEFIKSKVSNIVIINPSTDKVSLSLKKKGKLLKCRYNGSNKWYYYSEEKFLNKFKKQQ